MELKVIQVPPEPQVPTGLPARILHKAFSIVDMAGVPEEPAFQVAEEAMDLPAIRGAMEVH
jgi:hypothetical protein